METKLIEAAKGNVLKSASYAAWRSNVYKLLAFIFAYPNPMSQSEVVSILSLLSKYSNSRSDKVVECLTNVESEYKKTCLEALEEDYLRVFTHVFAADCNPCETSYTARHLFQLSQQMADITGFYHAFGLEVSATRPDHITVELEFLAFLTYKEASAVLEGRARQAAVCRSGQRRFLRDHLGRWGISFAGLIEKKAGDRLFGRAGALLKHYLESEAAFLSVKLASKGHLTPLAVFGNTPIDSGVGQSTSVFGVVHE